ncbi:MAG: tetratricopeptide repeat protein [Saprospiraceae bacterium]|nr:tetratricopeptide repeat protein [Saprospiraceae bacterium]
MIPTLQSPARPWLIVLLFFLPHQQAFPQSAADSLSALLPGMDDTRKAAFINEHFYTFYTHNYDSAIALGELALRIARQQKLGATEALTLKNIGIAEYMKGNYEKALALYQQALDLYEAANDRLGQGQVLREMGNYFKKTGQHDKALAQLAQSIQLCAEAHDTDGVASSLDIRGVVLLELGRLDEAEADFLQEKAILERSGNELGLSYTLNNLAAIATERGFYAQAIPLLERATAIRQRAGDEHGVAININNMGETWLQADRPDKALPYFQQALLKAEKIGFNDLRRHIMQMLADAFAANGNHALAMQWLQKSYVLKDSLFNVERSRQIAEMATRYESAKKEQEIARQEVKLQRRNVLLSLSVFGLVLLALVFAFVWRQQSMKQRQLEREAELKTNLARAELSNRLQTERLRISRDLHDNLGAELTIIGSALARKATQVASPGEKQELEAIGSNARQAMNQLRETIWAIRHEHFTLEQLAEKISDFAQRATTLPLRTQLPDGALQLSPTQTLNLYRIAQESLTNAAKHAEAKTVELRFAVAPEGARLHMSLADDGKGIESTDAQGGHSGYGLSNMQARAAELGGSLSVCQSGSGTIVETDIPL